MKYNFRGLCFCHSSISLWMAFFSLLLFVFTRKVTRSCCTALCCAWGCRHMDPRPARIVLYRVLRTSTVHEQRPSPLLACPAEALSPLLNNRDTTTKFSLSDSWFRFWTFTWQFFVAEFIFHEKNLFNWIAVAWLKTELIFFFWSRVKIRFNRIELALAMREFQFFCLYQSNPKVLDDPLPKAPLLRSVAAIRPRYLRRWYKNLRQARPV